MWYWFGFILLGRIFGGFIYFFLTIHNIISSLQTTYSIWGFFTNWQMFHFQLFTHRGNDHWNLRTQQVHCESDLGQDFMNYLVSSCFTWNKETDPALGLLIPVSIQTKNYVSFCLCPVIVLLTYRSQTVTALCSCLSVARVFFLKGLTHLSMGCEYENLSDLKNMQEISTSHSVLCFSIIRPCFYGYNTVFMQ
jgi:hypothetical protein